MRKRNLLQLHSLVGRKITTVLSNSGLHSALGFHCIQSIGV